LGLQTKCNQIKCPINCEMSIWSGFSKCTKDCEGGVQGRTRSILTKTKNGGNSCDTVQEMRSCNTGSCDRDCELHAWTPWEPCSMGCSGGMQGRVREVLVPIRGMGKCPGKKSAQRAEQRMCNTQDCVGDEICVAKQDLVIAIDSSGSLREKGADAVRDFAIKFTQRLKGKYYGDYAMKVGVLQFGNGVIQADGTVSQAIEVVGLTGDIGNVTAAIQGLKWQRGFTNMAQALSLAEKMLTQGGRASAQSAVLLLTDAKPSFIFQTDQKIRDLKSADVKILLVPVMEGTGQEFEQMKEWASAPWETHMVRIPGVAMLDADPTVFVEKAVATFCPKAMSPSSTRAYNDLSGFFLLKLSGSCGERGKQLGMEVLDPAACKLLAEQAGASAFAFGKGEFRKGFCMAEGLKVDATMISTWEENRADPACPEGEWKKDEFYDFYVIEPKEQW